MKETLDYKSDPISSSASIINSNINDGNVIILKQDDSSRKENLLRQLKISFESLMFGSNGSSIVFANTLHKFNPINILFCKNIMTILEDGFNLNLNCSIMLKNPSFISSTSSLDSYSPTEQINIPNNSSISTSTSGSSSISNSRKTTQTSLTGNNAPFSNKTNEIPNTSPQLWKFIFYILSDSNNMISSSSSFNLDNNIEYLAKKDFKCIYDQISQVGNPNQLSTSVLDWISYSLRQNCLLNQLTYLLNDDFILRKFYNFNSFLLDRTLVEDFLLFIKAYEQNNIKLIDNIKRTFFPDNQHHRQSDPNNLITKPSNHLKGHHKQNSLDLISTIKLQKQHKLLNSAHSIDLFKTDNLNVISTYSSINDLNIDGAISSFKAQSVKSLTDNLIETKINELNAANAIKQKQNKHRRMHSFPNIQINLLKKNSYFNNILPPTVEPEVNKFEESSDNLEKKTSSSIPKIILNGDVNNLEKVEKILNEKYYLEDKNKNELFEKTTIFDFIHSIQLQSECSQLDKENSYFIMADLAIVSNELIKTNELYDEMSLDVIKNYPNNIISKSNNILIKKNDINYFNSAKDLSFESIDMPSSLTSNNLHNNCSPSQALFIIDEKDSICINSLSENENKNDSDGIKNEIKFKRENWSKNQSEIINDSIDSELLNQNEKILFDLMDFSEREKLKFTTIFENNKPNITEDGFEVVNCKQDALIDKLNQKKRLNSQDTLRSRRYSWEEVNDEDTGEHFASLLIKDSLNRNFDLIKYKFQNIMNDDSEQYMNKQNKSSGILKILDNFRKEKITIYSYLVPKLANFEFYIRYLEYVEFMQYFNELKNSGKLSKIINNTIVRNSSTSTSLSISKNQDSDPNLSASTLYLSNQLNSLNSTKTSNNLLTKSSILFGSSLKKKKSTLESSQKSTNSSITSASRIKSAAIAAALTISLLQHSDDLLKKTISNNENNDIISIKSMHLSSNTLPINIINQEKTNKLLRQISYNILQDSVASSNEILINSLSQSYNQNIQSSHSSLVLNSYKNLNSRIIGDEIWAPVREQLILNITKKPNRLDQIKLQHFRCADCGIQVRQDKIKTFYYCEYFSKYFCRCCHINNQSYIPAYVINSLDFRSSYEVSKKAKNFLEKIFNEPLITLESLNPSLFENNTIFSRVKKLRYKLHSSRTYINSCRLAVDLKDKLYSQFDDFLINDQHVYSIETLFKIKKGNLFELLKSMVQLIIDHIKKCEICSQQGYICGTCNKKELLYPFDYEKVEKCPNCLACYHKQCFKSPEQCPRCERKRNRKLSSSNL